MLRALGALLVLALVLALPLGAKADFSPDPNDPPTTTGSSGTR